MKKKEIPLGIKIISVLYYISGILLGLFSLMSFIFIFIFILFGPFVLLGFFIFLGAGSVLAFFIARDLRKAKEWAREAVIFFSILGIATAIYSFTKLEILEGIIGIIVSSLIGGYILLNKDVKKFFKIQ